MADETVEVIKGGVMCIQIGVKRGVAFSAKDKSVGLTISVKTVKAVEDFMRSLGSGRIVDVSTVGIYWRSLTSQPLQAYEYSTTIPPTGKYDRQEFRIDQLGYPLIGDQGIVNLSFLRLIGVSEGAGVSFGLKGVYSLDGLRDLRDRLGAHAKRFYIDYIRPVDLSVQVTVQTSSNELQL